MASGTVSGGACDRESRPAVFVRLVSNSISLGGMIAIFRLFHDHVTQNVLTIGWVVLSLTVFFIYRAKCDLNPPERR